MKTTKPLQRKTPLRATTIKASKRRPARPKMTPARHKFTLSGFTAEWSDVYANEFAGTSVSVAMVAMERAA
jgi:hypothetical protein